MSAEELKLAILCKQRDIVGLKVLIVDLEKQLNVMTEKLAAAEAYLIELNKTS
jgi:hypothetical protein